MDTAVASGDDVDATVGRSAVLARRTLGLLLLSSPVSSDVRLVTLPSWRLNV